MWTTISTCAWLAAVASLDTTCMLHQNLCRGADSRMVRLVAWLEAIGALSNEAVKAQLTAPRNASKMAKQIVFYAFLNAREGVFRVMRWAWCGAFERRSWCCGLRSQTRG